MIQSDSLQVPASIGDDQADYDLLHAGQVAADVRGLCAVRGHEPGVRLVLDYLLAWGALQEAVLHKP